MIYDQIHTIPSRLFFQIWESGNYTLLDSENVVDIDQITELPKEELNRLEKLKDVWDQLEDADQVLSKNQKGEKVLNTSKSIEVLKCRQKKVELAIFYLKTQEDEELKQLLIDEKYVFTGDKEKDLSRIERLNRDLNVKIGKLEKKLPKPTEKGESIPFDQLVIGYGMIAEQTFRANEITQSEFRALENNVRIKLDSIAKNGG